MINAIFKTRYTFYDYELVSFVKKVNKIKNEKDVVKHVVNTLRKQGWNVHKIETHGQDGFPDLIAFKGDDYLKIECKYLRRKQLNDLRIDLKWQPTQLPSFVTALRSKEHHAVIVGKDNHIAFIAPTYFVKDLI